MSSGLTPTQDAWLRTQQMTETFSGFTAHEIATMPLDEFARLAGRPTIGQDAAGAVEAGPPGRPRQPAQTAPEPQGVPDFGAMGMAEYGAVRSKFIRPSSGAGRGLFDATN